MNSSVNPTHGGQGDRASGTDIMPVPVTIRFFCSTGLVILSAARCGSGNVRGANSSRDMLNPVVARYRDKVSRIYFRADAAFAMPGVYGTWKTKRMHCEIRLPANRVLQEQMGHLLGRPLGHPPNHVRRSHASFSYPARNSTKPRRVISKVEWHPGELVPRRRLHRDQHEPPGRAGCRLLQPARHQQSNGSRRARARSGRPRLSCPSVHHQESRLAAAPCARLQISATSCAHWRRPHRSRTGRSRA